MVSATYVWNNFSNKDKGKSNFMPKLHDSITN